MQCIRIYNDPDSFNTYEYASLEFSLEDKTRMLTRPVEFADCLNMCSTCQNALASEIEKINDRDLYYDSSEKRLAVLAYWLFRSPVTCGFANGCTMCERWT